MKEDYSLIERLKSYKPLIILVGIAIIIILVFLFIFSDKKSNTETDNGANEEFSLILNGLNPQYIIKGQKYYEYGFTARDGKGINRFKEVVVTNNINTNVSGEYEVIYKYNNIIRKRKVIVTDISGIIDVNEESNYANKVTINVIASGRDFKDIQLPSNEIKTSRSIEYPVNQNGTYIFIVHDKYGNALKLTKSVKNIDNDLPTGTCENTLKSGKTYVTVNASDNLSGIKHYVFNNGSKQNTSTTNSYIYDGKYENVTVTIYDKAGNYNKITCKKIVEEVEVKDYAPIELTKMEKNSSKLYTYSSNTMKITITNNGTFNIARIWVKDPYKQINKAVTSKWGSGTENLVTMMTNETKNKSLKSKAFIAINGSGFYNRGVDDGKGGFVARFSSNDPAKVKAYQGTSQGALIITNGAVVRNNYKDSYMEEKKINIYAISKEGNLDTYGDYRKLSEAERKKTFDEIINKGYKNTWAFSPTIMKRGTIQNDIKDIENSTVRNIFCQINRNNFIIILGQNLGAKNVKTLLTDLKCQTAVNFDGGGSTTMVVKNANSSTIKKIFSKEDRAITDALYISD